MGKVSGGKLVVKEVLAELAEEVEGVAADTIAISLMLLLAESATYKTPPLELKATPLGSWNEALAPKPSAFAADPLPARVDTSPPGVTWRMRLLENSATMTLPLPSTATP